MTDRLKTAHNYTSSRSKAAADDGGELGKALLCICSENQRKKTEAHDGQKCAQTPVGEKGDDAVRSPNLN